MSFSRSELVEIALSSRSRPRATAVTTMSAGGFCRVADSSAALSGVATVWAWAGVQAMSGIRPAKI
ncbi:hypothetical protein [Sphingomonas hankookensis]|uniref:hypothetical protein n=1 Tax=Sphingomonas hankookensis TaxID=563996 RepID=UPI001E36971F|nr:hypothetical protein [Sphingomonas hankookensis]